jgi:hypothetical protein
MKLQVTLPSETGLTHPKGNHLSRDFGATGCGAANTEMAGPMMAGNTPKTILAY